MSRGAASGDGSSLSDAVIELRRAAEMVRLANRLHALPQDPAARKRELLDGMIRLVDAHAGTCVVALPTADESPVVLASAHSGAAAPRKRRGANVDGHDHPHVKELLRRAFPRGGRNAGMARSHVDGASLYSTVRLDAKGTAAAISLVRGRSDGNAGGDGQPFDPVDQAVVDLVHVEMQWVYALDLPLASPEILPLSPRTKEILQLLLAGNSEKQVAHHLGLSLNTVHHYVKQLYRHFGVSTRSELLARWVRSKRATPRTPPRRRTSN